MLSNQTADTFNVLFEGGEYELVSNWDGSVGVWNCCVFVSFSKVQSWKLTSTWFLQSHLLFFQPPKYKMSIKKFGNRNSFAGSLPRKCRKAWSPGKPWEWNSRMMRRCLGHKRGLDEVVRAICHRRSMGKCIYPRHPADVRYLDPSNTPIKHQPWGGFWMSRVWVWAVEAHCFSQRFFAAIFGGLTYAV